MLVGDGDNVWGATAEGVDVGIFVIAFFGIAVGVGVGVGVGTCVGVGLTVGTGVGVGSEDGVGEGLVGGLD